MSPETTTDLLARGKALHQAGRLAEAQALYEQALARDPQNAEALHLLGLAAYHDGRFEDSVRLFDAAIERRPGEAKFHGNRGSALKALGRADEAQTAYAYALRCDSRFIPARFNLGVLFQEQNALTEAIEAYREILAAEPGHFDAWVNLGGALNRQGAFAEAEAAYRRALAINPDVAGLHLNLGNTLARQGRRAEALTIFRQALELQPDYPEVEAEILFHARHACAWDEAAVMAARLDARDPAAKEDRFGETPFLSAVRSMAPARNLAIARSWACDLARRHSPAFIHRPAGRAAEGPIRLGYLSSDIKDHATAHLMRSLFARHDRDRFRINLYSYGPDDGSDYRREIAESVDAFADIRETGDDDAARRIHADGVDILIDLKGWTQGQRLAICARRPAPVQATYLGFPGSTGADFLDYALVDGTVVTPELARHFSENLVFLPECYQANDEEQPIAAPPPTRAEAGLPEDGVVFACFNSSYKIEPATFAVWMEVLGAIPGSLLWLVAGNDLAPENLRREAAARGIDPERLVFAGKLPKAHHLARLGLADLALDTWTCNGHTTTSDALWAGVPVIALEGGHFASRVSKSLLMAVGLPELVSRTPEDYRALALHFGRDAEARAALRAKLAQNRTTTPLFDTGRFVRHLEAALEAMWRRYLDGQPPGEIRILEDTACRFR